jgi:hypothetical protein
MIQVVEFVHPPFTFVPHSATKEVKLLANCSESVARTSAWGSSGGLGA